MSLIAAQAGKSVPLPISGPVTISTGGTYTGHWVATGSQTAVDITTTQPVTIVDSIVENPSGDGTLIQGASGSQVTIKRTTLQGGNGRAYTAFQPASIRVENCDVLKTAGIYIDDNGGSCSSIVIQKNKCRNIQGNVGFNTIFFQSNGARSATIDVSWNEIINEFELSDVEDIINMYKTTGAHIHDNYIQGAYPASLTAPFSGSGIMLDDSTDSCLVEDNQVVDTVNCGIGIHARANNTVENNTVIFDGRDNAGNLFNAGNVGIFVWNGYADPGWANNQAHDNVSGWISYNGGSPIRNDWWLPDCSISCTNTAFGGTLDHAAEVAEWATWQAKKTANGIYVGV